MLRVAPLKPKRISNEIYVPIGLGELIDKITILEIKAERVGDENKLGNINRELVLLRRTRQETTLSDTTLDCLTAELRSTNERLWNLEDTIRNCERTKDFGELFVATARQIYRTNDQRAALKRQINLHLGSTIVEEKSYAEY
jgi:hypothetical protein